LVTNNLTTVNTEKIQIRCWKGRLRIISSGETIALFTFCLPIQTKRQRITSIYN